MMQRFLVLLVALTLSAGMGHAADRLALIIGNDSYSHVPALEKARNDASAMAETLTGLGFDVTRVLDADRRDMTRAISGFTARLQPGDTALVFFAGHGVEIDGENYLLPTDIEAPASAAEDFIKFESIGLSDILLRVQGTGARTTLMVIDACRDNPFAAGTGRSLGGSRGLARVTAPEGTFVLFSAGAQQQALDRLNGPDEDPNSVFTRALLPRLKEPGLELRQLVSEVRLEVRDLALGQNHQQFPAYYDELLGQFYFTDAAAPAPTPALDTPLQADFATARGLDTVFAYEAFLEKYQDEEALEVAIAARRLENLRLSTPSPTRTPEPVAASKPEPQPDPGLSKEIMRQSQARLNALGCSAGVADGVAGPRTRRAFVNYLTASGSWLSLGDLGTQDALSELTAARPPVCVDTTRQAAAAPATPQQVATEPQSLVGTWAFTAQCPLFIQSNGTTTYRAVGAGRYAVTTRDNLGNSANGTVTETGGNTLSVRLTWQNGDADNHSARLSADRRTITSTNYVGCTATARKQ